VALVAFLPFARGVLAGSSFYFRDLSLQFFPLRLFTLEGLRQGELRYWNPYTHEGEAVSLPLGYPLDLVALFRPTEAGLSLLLALHVPLAALAFFALARQLGVKTVGAAAGALLYALGGFALSTLNLYIYAQALAWAPLVLRGLMRAADGNGREVARAALPIGLAATTTGAEIVAQAVLVGVVLAQPRSRAAAARLALALGLGFGLAAFVLLPLSALVAGSARDAGFPTDVVLAHSVHPVTLLQTVLASLYGEPGQLAEKFWGQRYFPRGFPYIVSLYLGATALCLAALGLREGRRPGRLVAALAALALAMALGRYAGLGPLVETLDFVRRFRFPSKLFFTVHLGVAVLVGLGVDALATATEARPWRRLIGAAFLASSALSLFAGILSFDSVLYRYLLAGFFPHDLAVPSRQSAMQTVASDALTSAVLAAALGIVALLAARGRLGNGLAAGLCTGFLAADLLRAGAGLNPMVSPDFFRLSPAAERMAAEVRASEGRLFVLDPSLSGAYYRARALRLRGHEVWSFVVLRESFVPDFNLAPRVPTAMSLDRTMLVPLDRILRPEGARVAGLAGLLERLRAGAVSHVLSLEPLFLPDLVPVLTGDEGILAPLVTHLYRLKGTRPRLELLGEGRILDSHEGTDRLEIHAEAAVAARLVLRDALAPGWTARVDRKSVPLEPYQARYRAVVLPAGRSRVELRYEPPRRALGVALSVMAVLACAFLLFRRARETA
jgi:hypothetical protein